MNHVGIQIVLARHFNDSWKWNEFVFGIEDYIKFSSLCCLIVCFLRFLHVGAKSFVAQLKPLGVSNRDV